MESGWSVMGFGVSCRKGDWSDNDVMWDDYPAVKAKLNPVSVVLRQRVGCMGLGSGLRSGVGCS